MNSHLIVILSVSILSVLSEQTLPKDVVQKHYDVVPKKYDVRLEINSLISNEPIVLFGNVCIEFECKTNVREIKLHGKGQNGDLELYAKLPEKNFIKITNLSTKDEITIIKHKYDKESDLLTIETDQLTSENSYRLCIGYKHKISNENGYFVWGRADGVQIPNVKEYFIATNFQRQSAFPCFDEPNLTAKFKIQLIVPYTKGPPYPSTYSNDHTHKKTEWLKDPLRLQDTYILDKDVPPSQISFVVTTMKCYSEGFRFASDIKPYFISCHDVSNKFENVRSSVLKLDMMKFSLKFSKNYPKNIRFIVIPTKEKLISWKLGLVLISKEEVTDPSDVNRTHNVMIRLTSQFFGGMITPDSWESNWLFRALAKFCAYLQIPNDNQDRLLLMELPSKDLDMNMSKGVDNFQEETFGESKDIFIIQLIYSVLGQSLFEEALQHLFENFEYKQPAGPKEVWVSFDRKTKDFTDGKWSAVIEKWKTQPSYPLVTVTTVGDGKFEVTQELFIGIYEKKKQYELSKSQNNGEELCWMIPLSISVFDPKESKSINYEFPIDIQWLECNVNKNTVIHTKAKDVQLTLFNHGYRAFYRVKYDEKTLEKIVKTLGTSIDSLRPIARAQLVHDALTLAWMGYQDYKNVFSLLDFLVDEDSHLVWNAFFSGVFNLNEILKTSRETYILFQDYVRFIMTNTIVKMHLLRHRILDNMMKKEPITIYLTDTLYYFWACNVARIDICRFDAVTIYDFWMIKNRQLFFELFKNNQQIPSLFFTTLCSVLDNKRQYDEVYIKKVNYFFDDLMYYEEKNNIPTRYHKEYINVLGCISDSSIVNRFLDSWMSPDSKPMIYRRDEHKANVLLKLIDGPHTFLPTLEFFYKNIDDILIYLPEKEVMPKIVKAFTSKMQPNQISEMKAFVEGKPKLRSEEVLQAIKEGETAANRRAEWLAKNDLQIRTALKTFLSNINSQNGEVFKLESTVGPGKQLQWKGP